MTAALATTAPAPVVGSCAVVAQNAAPAATAGNGGSAPQAGGSASTGAATGRFQATPTGFIGPDGKPWSGKGWNVEARYAMQDMQGLVDNFPTMNMVRLVSDANTDTAQSLAPIIQFFTSRGIVVVIEDHNPATANSDSGWYSSIASANAGNPYVWLGLPNEPSANGLAGVQTNLMKTIAATGFQNPVAIEAAGGWDMGQIGAVLQQSGYKNAFIDAHIYYSDTNPNGPADYFASDAAIAQKLGVPLWIGEAGNAENGVTKNPVGDNVVTAGMAAAQSGQIAAITYWSAENGYHPEYDGACTGSGCHIVAGMATLVQGWMTNGSAPAPCVPAAAPTVTTASTPAAASPSPATASTPSPVSDPVAAAAAAVAASTARRGCGALAAIHGCPAGRLDLDPGDVPGHAARPRHARAASGHGRRSDRAGAKAPARPLRPPRPRQRRRNRRSGATTTITTGRRRLQPRRAMAQRMRLDRLADSEARCPSVWPLPRYSRRGSGRTRLSYDLVGR